MRASTSPESNQPRCPLRIAWTRTVPEEPEVTMIPPESVFTSRSTGPETVSDLSKDPCSSAEATRPAAKANETRLKVEIFIDAVLSRAAGIIRKCGRNVPHFLSEHV